MSGQIKILHLSASDSGGAYVFAENLKARTADGKFTVEHLIYTGEKENIRFSSVRWIDHGIKFFLHAWEKLIQSFHEKNKDVRFKFSLGYPGMSARKLKKICAPYDIVHLHWINKGFINIKHLKAIGKPLVWTCHDIWPVSGGCHLSYDCTNYRSGCGNCPLLKKPSDKDLSARIVKRKQKYFPTESLQLVAPSKWMFNNLETSTLGTDLRKTCIPNGVNTNIFCYQPSNERREAFTIGFAAANLNDKNKALFRVAEALGMIENRSDFKLLLIGRQKEAFDFEIPVTYEIIPDIDSAKDMAVQYRRMDVLICSSSLETYPTTLLEAFCCGVPGLGFAVGGVTEILASMGYKAIEPYDTKKLSEAIEDICRNYPEPRSLSEKACEQFSIYNTVAAYKELYKGVISE